MKVHLSKVFMFVEIIIFLLICDTTPTNATNGNDGKADEGIKVTEIFEKDIKLFVKEYAQQIESTTTTRSSNYLYLTYANAARIIQEIQEKVARKFIAKRKGDSVEIRNFPDTMAQINVALNQKIQMKIVQKLIDGVESLRFQELDDEQKQQHPLGPEANAELFYLLLAFARRMGDEIGHEALNKWRGAGKAEIHLYQFGRAQRCIEQMHPELEQRHSVSAKEHMSMYEIMEFEAVTAKRLIKLQFNGVLRMFDKAIKPFVKQFAQMESTSSARGDDQLQQQQQLMMMNLSFANASHIIREIQETVATKIVDKCNEPDGEMLNFHDTLSTINGKIQEGIQTEMMAHTSNKEKILKLGSFDVKEAEESHPLLLQPETNAELLHLLLTFAIRMGFTIGHTELNAVRDAGEAQINLHTFVHAQNYMEEIRPGLKDDSENSGWYHVVAFDSQPTEKRIKLNFNPGRSWDRRHVHDNLGTIKWLVNNSVNFSIERWLDLLHWRIIIVTTQLRYIPDGSLSDPVGRLIFGLTRLDPKDDNTIGFCAVKKFGTILANRLVNVVAKTENSKINRKTDKSKTNREKLLWYLEQMNDQYKEHCGEKLKKSMEKNGITYEMAVNDEIFMHYEDAIPFDKLKPIKEYKEIAEPSIKRMLLIWKQEFAKCEISHSGIVEKCDLKDILQQIEYCKMPKDHAGREFHDFVRVREFDVKSFWIIFQGEIEEFGKLAEEIKAASEKLEKLENFNSVMQKIKGKLSQMIKGKLSLKGKKEQQMDALSPPLDKKSARKQTSVDKKNARQQIIEKKTTLEREKGSVLEYLDKLIKKMDAIAWEKLLEWDKPIDRKQARHYFGQ